MSRERLIEALISIMVGVAIALLSLVIEALRAVDFSNASTVFNSAVGMLAYTLQRIKV